MRKQDVDAASMSSQALAHRDGVLLIGNFLSGTGRSRAVCEDLREHLAQSGWRVYSASKRPERLARLVDMLQTIWTYRREYRAAHVEVYSGPAFVWAEAACWLLRRIGRPYTLTLHGGSLPKFAKGRATRVRHLLHSAVAVTAPSPYLLKQMQSYRPDIRLVPNALDLDRYTFRLRSPAEPRLIWLRAFHSIYNPQLAIQVLHLISKRFPGATLGMIGPDKGDGTFEATRAEADKLGVTDRVQFPGPCAKAEVPEMLSRGDIFLNTSNVDNTPVSVIEAMACGLCTVSTNVGGIPDLLDHQRDSLLSPSGDARAMADSVERILDDPALARSLSENARAKAKLFAWTEILPRWQHLLGELTTVEESSARKLAAR